MKIFKLLSKNLLVLSFFFVNAVLYANEQIDPSQLKSIDNSCTFLRGNRGNSDILNDAKTILTNLQQAKAECQIPKAQYDTLEKAISAFKASEQIPNTYTDIFNPYTNQFDQISCYNYKTIIDSNYKSFISQLATQPNNQYLSNSKLFFSECYRDQDPPGCAASLSQIATNDYRTACANSATIIKDRRSEQIEIDGVRAVEQLLTQSISKMNDPNCKSEYKSVYKETMRATLNIGAQFANISSVTGLAGVGVMGAVEVLDSMLSLLTERRDFLKEMTSENNFNTVACFYKAIQKRAFNCAGFELEKNVELLQKSISFSRACQDNFSETYNSMESLSSAISKVVSKTSSASNLTRNANDDTTVLMDAIVDKMNGASPNEKIFWQNFKDNIYSFAEIDEKDPKIIKSFKLNQGSRNEQRAAIENLRAFKKRITKFQEILEAHDQANHSLNNDALEARLREFSSENKGDFILYVDEIMTRSNQINDKTPVSFLAEHNAREQVLQNYYSSQQMLRDSAPSRQVALVLDGLNNNFSQQVLNRLDILSNEFNNIRKIGPKSSAAERTNQFALYVKPLLDICALLEPVNKLKDLRSLKESDSNFTKSCAPFSCGDGSGVHVTNDCPSSKGFFGNINPQSFSNSGCFPADKETSLENYKRKICSQDNNYESLLKKFQDEYEKNGTICGK